MTTAPDATLDASTDAGNPVLHVVYRYGKPYWPEFSLGLLLQVLGQIPGRVPALVVGVALDAVFLQRTPFGIPLLPEAWVPATRTGQFWFSAALIGGTMVLGSLFALGSRLAYGWFQQHLLHDVRTDTFDAMQRLRLAAFESQQTGDVLSVLNNDVENLQEFTGGTIGAVIRFPFTVALSFAFMATLNLHLAAALLVVPVGIFAFAYWHANYIEGIYEDIRQSVGDINVRLEKTLSGIETVKATASEPREREQVEAVSRARAEHQWRITRINGGVAPVVNLVQNLGIVAIIVVGGSWILGGTPSFVGGGITAGALFTFVSYVRDFVQPMRQLASIVDSYENAKASASRLVDLVAEPDVIPEAEDATELDGVDGAVAYEGVRFGYDTGTRADGGDPDGELTVRDVTFEAAPGETVGLVGPTGAGKSTLLKLLFRFYDVDEGSVRVDGHDVRDVTRRSLRRHLGYVGQDPFLFSGTVAENVTYGDDDPDEGDLERALDLAGAAEFVADLPEGVDTQVGERGVKLSGGQRQRLALARALYRDPDVLVLDEATSHVDTETEAAIQESLARVTGDCTTFVVAHRLSTVRHADHIVVLDGGEVVERGDHEELLETDGLYATLWAIQVGDVEALPEEFLERARARDAEVAR